jgi:hypothetical protein
MFPLSYTILLWSVWTTTLMYDTLKSQKGVELFGKIFFGIVTSQNIVFPN